MNALLTLEIIHIVGLAFVLLTTIPILKSIAQQYLRPAQPDTQYSDPDGTATDESKHAFSDKWQRWAIVVISIFGAVCAVTMAILSERTGNVAGLSIVSWLQLIVWALLSIQACSLLVVPLPSDRFRLCQYMFWSSLIALALSGIRLVWSPGNHLLVTPSSARFLMAITTSAFIRMILTLLTPRRPDVYRHGKLIDRQDTTCMLSRYSFAWADSLLKYIAENQSLGVEELPELAFWQRSENLSQRLENARTSHKTLLGSLVYTHGRSLTLQGILTLVSSSLSVGPQLAVYGILRSMEAAGPKPWILVPPWLLVSALGLSMILAAGVEAWVMWLTYSQVCFPMTAELTSIIFQKMMRRKDVRYFPPTGQSQETGSGTKGERPEEDRTTQNVINLVAIDGGRITTFISYTYLVPASALKLLISCGFLLKLIGWQSLFSGLLVSFLSAPFKSYCTKQYAQAQKNLMSSRDEKLAIVTEALQGIRQIKMSATEEQWQNRLSAYRVVELHALRSASLFMAGLFSLTTLDPLLMSAVSLPVYALTYGTLEPSVAFTAISLFASLELSLGILPDFFTKWFEAGISSRRIDQFLNEPDKEEITRAGTSITFDNAAISWPSGTTDNDETFALRGLQLQFPVGKLSVISGKTGSGKSLLLQAILGECDLIEGAIYVPSCSPVNSSPTSSADWILPSTIAYVAQIPWIENTTIKENVLFGLPYNSSRYQAVLSDCALIPDLAVFDNGDNTEVGVNGINLSGGQRWRLCLARALYSRAETLIIDDIFSALDTQTSSHVYRNALTGAICSGRTRILATHHIDICLPGTDYFVYLENMAVKYAGNPKGFGHTMPDTQSPKTPNGAEAGTNELVDDEASQSEVNTKKAPIRSARDEERATGSTDLKLYRLYIARGGLSLWALVVMLYASYTALIFGRSWWIKAWANSSGQDHSYYETNIRDIASLTTDGNSVFFYLRIYIILSAIACLLGIARNFGIVFAALRASRRLYDELVFVIIRAPMQYLDSIPLGRLLNLFSADFSLIDSRMGQDAGFVLGKGLDLIAIVIAGVIVSPALVLVGVVVIYLCKRLSTVYLAGAREVQRLESTSRGVVYDHFTSNLSGLVTIRAFKRASFYVQDVYIKVDRHTRASWNLWLFNRWLGLRMNIFGAIFSTLTATFVVYMPQVSAGLAGFALSFALQYSSAITQFIRQAASFELDMNAVERVLSYTNTEVENPGGKSVPAAWPTQGEIEVHDLITSYTPNGPPVLKGLNFHVSPHERIGIVGRTGAGKSSLALTLFRFITVPEGTVYIDGVDISKIKLHDLRSRITMVPQDPVLFSGTLRSNLDPFREYADSELQNALQRVGLTVQTSSEELPPGPGHTSAIPGTAATTNTQGVMSLNTPISERGLNLSQGQRQLVCLARAMISRPKVLVIDEGTSAVDMATDRMVQQLIHDEFQTSTLLVIAHRLSTVADFSRILVLDKGEIVEFGTPKELMEIKDGYFRDLVEASGERDAVKDIIFG